MDRERTRAAWYRAALLLAGVGWLWIGWASAHPGGDSPCLFRALTHLPCPSCGTTRSVMEIAQGHPADGLATNPLGLVAALGLVVIPLLGTADALTGKSRLQRIYKAGEDLFRTNRIAQLTAIFLLTANWFWGILKHL